MSFDTSTALATRATISAIVRTYETEAANIRAAFAMVAAAERNMGAVIALGGDSIRVGDRHHRSVDWNDPSEALARFNRTTWEALVERLEIRRMLSVKRATELDKQLRDGELPEITEQSVADFASFYSEHLPDMLDEAVREVFDWLRPRHDHHKTNDLYQIGPRVVITHMVSTGFGGKWKVSYYREANLSALENVLNALDGKGQILKSYRAAIVNSIEATPIVSGEAGKGETDLFAWKAHRNGTLHLRFKRPDLVRLLNQRAGGMRLRPGEAA